MNHAKGRIHSMTIGGLITRFITANLILYTIAFFTPELNIVAYFGLFVVATILTIFDYLMNAIISTTPYGILQGIIGFFISSIVLYFTQFFIPNFTISKIAMTMAALIYAMIATIIPKQAEE